MKVNLRLFTVLLLSIFSNIAIYTVIKRAVSKPAVELSHGSGVNKVSCQSQYYLDIHWLMEYKKKKHKVSKLYFTSSFRKLSGKINYVPKPTVVPYSGFNAAEDVHALRSAMKGLGTDEQAIINILTARCSSQRQEIKRFFLGEYGRDIIEDLKSELGGKFEDVIIGLMTPPDEYLCKQLHKAMSGIRTEEQTLVEILCSRPNEEVVQIVKKYEDMYDRPLAEHMCSETSGHFRRLLMLIVAGVRHDANVIDPEKAREQAESLYAAGEAKLGTDEEVFNRVMEHASYAQLRLVFEEYKNLSGMTIEQTIKHEMSGELHDAMIAIVECVQSPPAFFARRLHNAMKGLGTDDTTLIRIIVSRSEIDLANTKEEFERLFDRTLLSAVKSKTSGDYKRALAALIGGA